MVGLKKTLIGLCMVSLTVTNGLRGMAERGGFLQGSRAQAGISQDTITRGKYTLIFINKEPGFDTVTRQKMIAAFFKVYPIEAKRFNKHTLGKVVFVIDPTYEGVAETEAGVARYNPRWLKSHPEDIDVVTHEVMHIVQDYRHDGPGWLTEGIADYVRYVYGVNNVKGGWTLPDYRASQSYNNAYRITARFLVWVEKNKNRHIVDKMDAAMRDGTYTPELWVKLTGKTLDALWTEYGGNPTVALVYH
jgi:basic secretory peptidase family protein